MVTTLGRSARIGRRTVISGTGAAVLGSGLAMPAIAQNKPIRMGWIAAVTGAFSSNAQAQDWGFHTMVQDLNDAGGVNGRKLEIVMRDSAGDPSKAVSFAKELVYNEKVDVVCGPINSGEVLPTVTISVGIAARDRQDSAAALLAEADVALYAAKGEGRNRVRIAA